MPKVKKGLYLALRINYSSIHTELGRCRKRAVTDYWNISVIIVELVLVSVTNPFGSQEWKYLQSCSALGTIVSRIKAGKGNEVAIKCWELEGREKRVGNFFCIIEEKIN